MSDLRLAVLISAGGTTLKNLIDRIADGRLHAKIVHVISSNPEAYGIERAQNAGLPTTIVGRREAGSRELFSQRIFDQCRDVKADLVCLAGFLQLITIPEDFRHRVINIHPSLIPAFCGKGFYGHHVHEAVLEFGAKITGCTVHFADNEYDHGPIILQKAVAVEDSDTAESLSERVFQQECEALPEAIRLYAQGKIRVVGRRVYIKND